MPGVERAVNMVGGERSAATPGRTQPGRRSEIRESGGIDHPQPDVSARRIAAARDKNQGFAGGKKASFEHNLQQFGI
jgi:hypothetical protein